MINNADYRLKKRHQSYQSRVMLGTVRIPGTDPNMEPQNSAVNNPTDPSSEYLRCHSRKRHWSNMQPDAIY